MRREDPGCSRGGWAQTTATYSGGFEIDLSAAGLGGHVQFVAKKSQIMFFQRLYEHYRVFSVAPSGACCLIIRLPGAHAPGYELAPLPGLL